MVPSKRLICCLTFICMGWQLQAAIITSSSSGGNWASSASWEGGTVPTAEDNVVIVSSVTLTSHVVWETICKNLTITSAGMLTVKALLNVSGDVTNKGVLTGNKWIYCKGNISNYGEWSIRETFVNGPGEIQPIYGAEGTFFNTTLHIRNNLISSSNVSLKGEIDFDNSFYWEVNSHQLELLNNANVRGDVYGSIRNAVIAGQGNLYNLNLWSVKNTGTMHFSNIRFYTWFENAGMIISSAWDVAYGDLIISGNWSGSTVYMNGDTDQTVSYTAFNLNVQFNGSYYKDGVMYWIVRNPTPADYGIYSNGIRNIIFQEYQPEFVWTGIIDTDWNKIGNWSSNIIPTAGSEIKIPDVANDPVIESGVAAYAKSILVESSAMLTIYGSLNIESEESGKYDLQINDGARVTVMPNGQLKTATGGILNNAGISGLVINSTPDGTGSLIHETDHVLATVKRYIDGNAADWHFLASPVQDQGISGDWTPPGTYGDGTGYDLYVWDEPTSCWVYNLNMTLSPSWYEVHPQNNFVTGRGYLYSVQTSNITKQFVGYLNNGIVNIDVTANAIGIYNGFNLLGNPYTSSIDWKAQDGFSRNMLYPSGGGYDIWIWSSTANNYGVYNSGDIDDYGTNNVSRYIAPMQAFFIRAAYSGSFGFNNSARVHNEASAWLKKASTEAIAGSIRLTIEAGSEAGSDEVRIDFGQKERGTLKLFSPVETAPDLYLPAGGENYSVRRIGDIRENKLLQLGLKVGVNDNYTLRCDYKKTDFGPIYLKDQLNGVIHSFNDSNNYSFYATTNDESDRFTLYFGVVPKATNAFPEDVKVYVSKGFLIIDLNNLVDSCQIQITDLCGRVIYRQFSPGRKKEIYTLKTRGVYIVTVYSGSISKGFKVVF